MKTVNLQQVYFCDTLVVWQKLLTVTYAGKLFGRTSTSFRRPAFGLKGGCQGIFSAYFLLFGPDQFGSSLLVHKGLPPRYTTPIVSLSVDAPVDSRGESDGWVWRVEVFECKRSSPWEPSRVHSHKVGTLWGSSKLGLQPNGLYGEGRVIHWTWRDSLTGLNQTKPNWDPKEASDIHLNAWVGEEVPPSQRSSLVWRGISF